LSGAPIPHKTANTWVLCLVAVRLEPGDPLLQHVVQMREIILHELVKPPELHKTIRHIRRSGGKAKAISFSARLPVTAPQIAWLHRAQGP
jgi:hypothetical protein